MSAPDGSATETPLLGHVGGVDTASDEDTRARAEPLAARHRETSKGLAWIKEGTPLAAVLALYSFLVNQFWFVTEDAFISFRYAKNWAAGHGPRFNLGNELPVEGYTNFLWVAASAAFERLGGPAPTWSPRLSFLLGALLIVWLWRSLRRELELGPLTSIVATAWLALLPPIPMWSTSGLETIPFAFAFFGAFDRMVLRRSAPSVSAGAALGIAVVLLRAEGIAWAVAIGLGSAVRYGLSERHHRVAVARYLGIVIAAFVLFVAWRYSYYQDWVPNTAHAKVGVGPSTLRRGLSYVAVYWLTLLTPVVCLACIPSALKRDRRRVGVPVTLGVLGFYAYAIVIGGDFMAMGRVILPALPLHAVLLAWGLADLALRLGSIGRLVAPAFGVALIGIGLLPGWDHHLVPKDVRASFHFRHNTNNYRSEYAVWQLQRGNHQTYGDLGKALGRIAKPGESFVIGPIGNVGYYSGLYIYDQYGLVDRDVARRPLKQQKLHSPGHDKFVPATYFLKRRPTFWSAKLFSKRGARRAIQGWAKKHEAFGLKNNYVPDFRVIEGETFADGRTRVLAVLRAGDPRRPAEQWKEFRERSKRL